MIVYLVIGVQCILILHCLIRTIIHKIKAPCILTTKKKYNEKMIVAFAILTMCSLNIVISMNKVSLLVLGCAIMFFLCGLLCLTEGIIKPYISEEGVVSNCKIYRWNNMRIECIKDSTIIFQAKSYLGERKIVVDLEEIKEEDVRRISEYLKV